MQPQVVLVVAYAAALTVGAIALHRRGRRSPAVATGNEEWTPHSEVPKLHSAVALVAAGAAALLPIAALIVFRQVPEVIVLVITGLIGLTTLVLLAAAARRSAPPSPGGAAGPSPNGGTDTARGAAGGKDHSLT
jgi:hypothetical protein